MFWMYEFNFNVYLFLVKDAHQSTADSIANNQMVNSHNIHSSKLARQNRIQVMKSKRAKREHSASNKANSPKNTRGNTYMMSVTN